MSTSQRYESQGLLAKLWPENMPDIATESEGKRLAQKNLSEHGLPSLRDERWKYTSLKLLERRQFEPDTAINDERLIKTARSVVGDLPSSGLIVFSGSRSITQAVPDWLSTGVMSSDASLPVDTQIQTHSTDGFIWLNLSYSDQVLQFKVPANTSLDTPLHVVYIEANTATVQHIRHAWQLGENASIEVVEHFVTQADATQATATNGEFNNLYRNIVLEAGSQLYWTQLQQASSQQVVLQHTHIEQHADSVCAQTQLDLGGRLLRHETRAKLAGEKAAYQYAGLLLGQARQHRDQQVYVQHAATNCCSEQSYRSVLTDHARGVVTTAATVDAGADGSDVQQHTASIVLTNTAEMDAKPQLEINADEVVASHGATIGQLEEEAIFYLQSRGIPEAQARHLLIAGFTRVAVDSIHNADVREYCIKQMEHQLSELLPSIDNK